MWRFRVRWPVADHEVHHLTEDDLEGMMDVYVRSRRGLPFERPPSADEMRLFTLGDPSFRPEGSWIVRSGGAPVAYAFVLVEDNRLSAGLDDAYIEFEVVPEARGRGLEESLVSRCTEYIKSRGVGKGRSRVVDVESWRLAVLSSVGFKDAYRVFTLVRKGRAPVPEVPLPEGVTVVRRPCKECGDEELTRIVEAFNDSFKDHLSFAPEDPQKFIRYRDVGQDPEIISIAMAGDDIAGLCLSDVSKVYNERNGTKWGWVGVLGVRQRYRRRGLGRFLLADGMRWILEQGMDTIHIGVFAKNENALGLYLSVGFEKERESFWYEKRLV